MTKEECAKLLTLTKSLFSNAYRDLDESGIKMLISSWYNFFEDIPVEVMVKVIQKHSLDSDFAPSIREMRESALKIIKPHSLVTPNEAWEVVFKAIGSYGWSNEAKAMNSFSEPIKRAIRLVGGWQRVCQTITGQSMDFLRKDFLSAYDEFNSEEKQQYLMPEGMLVKLQEMVIQRQLEVTNEQKQLPEM